MTSNRFVTRSSGRNKAAHRTQRGTYSRELVAQLTDRHIKRPRDQPEREIRT